MCFLVHFCTMSSPDSGKFQLVLNTDSMPPLTRRLNPPSPCVDSLSHTMPPAEPKLLPAQATYIEEHCLPRWESLLDTEGWGKGRGLKAYTPFKTFFNNEVAALKTCTDPSFADADVNVRTIIYALVCLIS
jgi:hypothetical protein